VNAYSSQSTEDGAAGNGYSVTPFGRQWLAESDQNDFVPTEPERFAQMLAPYRSKFGADSSCNRNCQVQRADVLSQYASSGGRRRVGNLILGKLHQELRDEYKGYFSLLKYSRDQAAHGMLSGVKDNEAYTALALLLRFAMYASDHWTELTS
jgi:hypothetical protein